MTTRDGALSGGGNGAGLSEHVDADQLDLGDELSTRDRPDPTGVGAALKAHWRATVQDEVARQCQELRVRPRGQTLGEEKMVRRQTLGGKKCSFQGQTAEWAALQSSVLARKPVYLQGQRSASLAAQPEFHWRRSLGFIGGAAWACFIGCPARCLCVQFGGWLFEGGFGRRVCRVCLGRRHGPRMPFLSSPTLPALCLAPAGRVGRGAQGGAVGAVVAAREQQGAQGALGGAQGPDL
eukprot:363802-Chlamydomonas_euryale.AAC.6